MFIVASERWSAGMALGTRRRDAVPSGKCPQPAHGLMALTTPMPRGKELRLAAASRRGPGPLAPGRTAQWPLQNFLELGALPSAVPRARLYARHVLWEWALTGLIDSAELLVSELVTNAVQASRAVEQATPVWLGLLSDSAQILILVWDISPHPPVRTDVADDAETGRGLLLVDAISEQWDWYVPEDSGGKVVWARLGKARGHE
ncbi:MAG TPA: ATP-binding protein [Streptosporangiaceae bacterium]|jgi:anti-sigma regulatory factor (Ser/Thr protein kinase)|nr:ATP-binding protein [Streptosporangiaceae bacterium]